MPDVIKHPPALKLLMIVVERSEMDKLEDFLREKWIAFHYMINAMGTARSELLQTFGLSGSEKTICACVIRSNEAERLVESVSDHFSLTKPGNGIVYTIPISGISAVISRLHSTEDNERNEDMMEDSGKKTEAPYSMVVSVINQGFSETLMDVAHAVGVRGGTIINARHSAIEDTVKFFGVTLQAEKEVVVIVVPSGQKAELMHAIGNKCGLNTEAGGIIVSLPVDNCAGIGTQED